MKAVPEKAMRWPRFASLWPWFAFNSVAITALIAAHYHFGLSAHKWWPDLFAVLTNLLAGGLVSFLFYFLVVYIPEKRKKSIIKANLQKMYRRIKLDMLWAIVQASIKGGRHDLERRPDFVESLMKPETFKVTFDGGRNADEGFYAFANQMREPTLEYKKIVQRLTLLSQQVEYVLHNYTIEDQEVFDFFKRVEVLLMDLQADGPGYDESEPLCRFVWEVFAGWNSIDGDVGQDPIQKMIDGL